ncbi:ATP-binding cassette domain-containing protein [Kribbella deserti]|uniref:ATP-binding cassette domain-containing protein n=1 Tax=Kribbella deserti TaxID=1926257 RepID=A0ABV6QVB8_9ACTN
MTTTAPAKVTAALHGVTKTFDGRKVLDDVSFAFQPATRYVVTGRSGCGKSTLLNLLAGYLEPDLGRVSPAVATGYLFQDELLFSSLTVRQNLGLRLTALGLSDHQRRTTEALARAEVGGLIDNPVSQLSGGERQRVQLATLLVASPQLVLMDEPTSKLDAETRLDVGGAVLELFADQTVVVVSHEERSPLSDGAIRLRLQDGRLDHD